MADNHPQSRQRNDATINLLDPFEVEYWVNTLDVSAPELRAAVGWVGASSAAVERHLGVLRADDASTAPTELGLHVELGVVPGASGGFRGTFKVFAVRGAAMALMHASDGTDAAIFRSEEDARADASTRAELWILEGGPLPSASLDPQGF